jgi:DNA-binding XRE family transcriptional regulator
MTPKELAHRLRKYRKEAGYSQAGAARLIGVTPTQLMEWEKGKRIPLSGNLLLLGMLYHRQIEDLYYELRMDLAQKLQENKIKYGEFGVGNVRNKPP